MSIACTLGVDGIALLCQLRRGVSLDDFMALVDAVNSVCPCGSLVISNVLLFCTESGQMASLLLLLGAMLSHTTMMGGLGQRQ
jgi:hypothetical protein